MNIRKKCYSVIASFTIILALAIMGFVSSLNINKLNTVEAYSVPTIEVDWLTDITDKIATYGEPAYNIRLKSYNTYRNGSQLNPMLIMNTDDLAYLVYLTYNNRSISETPYYYALGADIDLAGKEWIPLGIGPNNSAATQYHFRGAIDGTKYAAYGVTPIGTYKIQNMSVVDTTWAYKGLIAN